MKKMIVFCLLAAILLLSYGCSSVQGEEDGQPDVVVTTTFIYDMVQVLSEGVDAFDTSLIIPAGEDPHIYQPKASDLALILDADTLLYQGLNFEGRMADVLDGGTSITEDFDETALLQEGEGEADPHFWFDIELYKSAVNTVSSTLSEDYPEHTDAFLENKEAYFKSLNELDDYVEERIDEIPESSRLVITPHDAFGYLAANYDLEVHAPQGISTDAEVSNNTIEATADLIMENNIKAVFIETTTNPDRMQRLKEIIQSRGGSVEVVGTENDALLSDSLGEAGSEGDTYISMFRHNIDTITDHLK
ncbi:zinc ABC transporter substrate-binding protein [Salinicoccus sp. ID82-1]|uniref:metal ABC transporter solute-binding protein, Zn/Mn family n=1 Tax=Salinicoccus sp. ID82-1 TaxID=2820269 RepID=UPI001F3F11F9|nr:zinc ABC transporter substrate-binding protein [Salinicoccus sp. ID82-1]MCG1010331.1 zinc ABC transporter substrate-binding protein [Salinicoccus sp. ID82-1]